MLEIIWVVGVWLFELSLLCSGTAIAGVSLVLLVSWWRRKVKDAR